MRAAATMMSTCYSDGDPATSMWVLLLPDGHGAAIAGTDSQTSSAMPLTAAVSASWSGQQQQYTHGHA